MKKSFIITIVAILFSISIHSQITKGNWMVGGDAIIRGYKFENTKKYEYNAEIFPKIGYFISNNFVVGTELGIYINNGTFYTSFVPFGRYYVINSKKTVNPFIEGGFGIESIKSKSTKSSITESMHLFKVGTSIFFTNSAALNITINYKNNSFQFAQEISFAVGFQIHLERK